jgi:hypothetical protein
MPALFALFRQNFAHLHNHIAAHQKCISYIPLFYLHY